MKWQPLEVALTNVHGYNRDVFINENELSMCGGCQKNVQLINVIECIHYMFIPFSKINKSQKK